MTLISSPPCCCAHHPNDLVALLQDRNCGTDGIRFTVTYMTRPLIQHAA